MSSTNQTARMGSLLRHVTFKTAALGFTSLLIAAIIFIYYPSEKLDQQASLSKISAKNQETAEDLVKGAKAIVEGQPETTQVCKRIDLEAKMNWDELKSEAMNNFKLVQKKGFLEEFDNAVIYYREVLPATEPKGTLLFLHGMRFKSLTWQDLGTLNYMACHGYRAVAVDLPGYGESKKADVSSATFMTNLMKTLNMKQAVIVSPSMSGSFSIPFLKDHPEVFKGFVPVAPVGTNKLSSEEYGAIEVPTLIVYGEKDESIGLESLKALKNLKNNEIVQLKEAGHAAYMDKPLEFHHHLLTFCDKLYA